MANKIIVVMGPHEGVGKTTLCVNLAARYAQARHQPVVILDTDALCQGETATVAGTTSPTTIFQLLDQLAQKQLTIPMLRSHLSFNRLNIAVLSLALNERESARISQEQWAFFLQAISQTCDVIIDMEATSPLKVSAIDLADAVIWPFLPNALSLKATLRHLDFLQNQKLGLQKFIFATSQTGSSAFSLSEKTLNDALSRVEKEILVHLPLELELIHLLNDGRPSVMDSSKSPYYQQIGRLLEILGSHKRTEGASSNGRALGIDRRNQFSDIQLSKLQHTVTDNLMLEKRKRWDVMKQNLHRNLVEELNIRRIDLDTKGDPVRERQLRTNVESTVNSLIGKEKDLVLNREERERLVKELVDEALGLGPLEELLADTTVTEIMVNRFDQVFIERKGKITLSNKRFIDNNHVIQVVRRIISPLGRRIDESVPMVDARLKDGSRVNAIIPPLAVNGPSITIRRFPEKAFTAEDLVKMNAISPDMVEFLKVCVLTRKNMIISGGTGTGKTTILNMLSSFIPNDDRIITVEDTAELRMQQEHVVRLEARTANIEGQGQVSIRDLVKNCLRMRPDRIVIGECRGGEALDMLQAMNTGHEGSLTTIHANTPRDAFTRLETLCLMAGMDLPVWALREQIRSAVHIVVQLTRMQDGSRKVTCITEVVGRDEETILSQDLFRFTQDSIDAQGKVHGRFEPTGVLPKFLPELKSKGFSLDVSAFRVKEPRS